MCTCLNGADSLSCTACGAGPPGSWEDAPGEDAPGEDAPGEDAPGENAPLQSASLGSGNGNGCKPRWQTPGLGRRRTCRLGGHKGRGSEADRRRASREAEVAAREEGVEGEDEDAAPVAPAPEDVAIGEDDGLSAAEQAEHDLLTSRVARGIADKANARQAEQAQQAATLIEMNRRRAEERRTELAAAAAAAEAAYPAADRAAAANDLARLTTMNLQLAQQQDVRNARATCAARRSAAARRYEADASADAAAREARHVERMHQARVHRIETSRQRAEAVAAEAIAAAGAEAAMLRMMRMSVWQWRKTSSAGNAAKLKLTSRLPNDVPLDCRVGEKLLVRLMLKEGLHQHLQWCRTPAITQLVGGGTMTTLALVRTMPRRTTVIGLLVNNGTAGDNLGCVVTGMLQSFGNKQRC